jgi:hypothetical protein
MSVSTFEPLSAYPLPMPFPETIPIRYSEEEAGYVTIRPVVRQMFRLDELLDMILSVAGKDVPRVRQILHSGTVVYHFYRYSWDGFEADEAELAAALSRFPDADPSRPFSAGDCTVAIFESGGLSPRHLFELSRAAGSKRRLLRGLSFWDGLLEIAANETLWYHGYSYSRRADVYRLDLDGENTDLIAEAAEQLAPRSLQPAIRVLAGSAAILFVCPRSESRPSK